jgi:hypothetical protein
MGFGFGSTVAERGMKRRYHECEAIEKIDGSTARIPKAPLRDFPARMPDSAGLVSADGTTT